MPLKDLFNIDDPHALSVELPEDMLKTNPELKELMDMLKELEASFPPHPAQPPYEEQEKPKITSEAIPTDPPAKISEKSQTTEIENMLAPCLSELQLTELNPNFFEQAKERKIQNRTNRTVNIIFIFLFIFSLYLFFNFDTLSRNPNWHPAIEKWCAIFNCRAPLPENISQIKTSSLILHPDVKHKNKLLLDAIIYNQANFAQPFPRIVLLLSDRYQQPIVQHEFLPAEYRQGQLLHLTTMPSQQPIHITLSIPDPKIPILNYELKFYSSLQNEIKRYHTSHVPKGN